MQTPNEILNFDFSPSAFHQAAKSVFSANILQLHEFQINKLKKITDEVGETCFKFESEPISRVYKKFKIAISENPQHHLISINNFDKRELKTLSYCLDYCESNKILPIIASANQLSIALKTLERNWRDVFLLGLIRCFMKNWESKYTDSFKSLNQFIFDKLKQYDGGVTVLKSFKTNMKFYDLRNGDFLLGSELAIKNKHIKEATKYLFLPNSWFTYSYFSRVILAYYEKRKLNIENFIDDLNLALIEHKNQISNKRLVSKLILQANETDFSILQDKVKSIAFKLIGDSGNASYWTPFENATANEKEDLKKARSILNEWITRQFINVFFEKCINDKRRKSFWLKYAKEISQFRVIGSSYIKHLLITDDRISEYVLPRFSKTNSARESNAALMFVMKNYLFVEFSDNGSFYVYKTENKNCPSLDTLFYQSTSDLKISSYRQLIYRTGTDIDEINDEGKLSHRDGDVNWENVAKYWIKEKLKIDV